MKICIYLFCIVAMLSCAEEKEEDIRPLIPGEYSGDVSYFEYNEKTEDFELNSESFQVSAVVLKIDHPTVDLYEIEFSNNHFLEISPFRFSIYPLFDSYAGSAFIRVHYGGYDPCHLHINSSVDEKNGGHFSLGSDKIGLTINRYYCTEPENSYKIVFAGSQMLD